MIDGMFYFLVLSLQNVACTGHFQRILLWTRRISSAWYPHMVAPATPDTGQSQTQGGPRHRAVPDTGQSENSLL